MNEEGDDLETDNVLKIFEEFKNGMSNNWRPQEPQISKEEYYDLEGDTND
jgi:hypothetical protein